MRLPLKHFPEHTIEQYNLRENAKNGWVYVEIRKAIYGLPQAGKLANDQLKQKLAPAGYYKVPHTPGLFTHVTRPIQFTLVVDDVGVKYVGKEHAGHLIKTLETHYDKISVDWEGKLYCGITLEWNHEEGFLSISMPGYTDKLRARYKHEMPSRPQHSAYKAPPKVYGKAAQNTIRDDVTAKLDEKRVKAIQQIARA